MSRSSFLIDVATVMPRRIGRCNLNKIPALVNQRRSRVLGEWFRTDDRPNCSPMNSWYIRNEDNTENGPLRPGELLALVRKGGVLPTTMLRKNDSAWFTASKVGGLFEAASRPEVRHFCPYCNKPVTKPPTSCVACGMDVYHSVEEQVSPEESADRSGTAKRSIKGWLKKKKLK